MTTLTVRVNNTSNAMLLLQMLKEMKFVMGVKTDEKITALEEHEMLSRGVFIQNKKMQAKRASKL